MKNVGRKILKNELLCLLFLKFALWLHNKSYVLSSRLAIILNDGVHPKHKIINYKKWFCDRVEKAQVVLDIGCNTGILAKALSEKASFVYGVEIFTSHIKKANETNKAANVEYICADATKYDYSNCKPIDVVVLSNVLEHIENRVEFLKNVVSQVKWKSNPKFLIRVPMLTKDWISVYKKELGIEWRTDKGHFTEYSLRQLEDECRDAGLKFELDKIEFGEFFGVGK